MQKLIIVTGASRGLGRAMCLGFASRGHQVFGCARSKTRFEELAKATNSRSDYAVLDVADAEQVADWAKRIIKEHGAPDLLVNNAALLNENAPLWEVPTTDFSNLIDVNIKGVFHTIAAFAPAMVKAKKGVIVNFSSGWGRSVAADVAPYCASKWAIEGLSTALAEDLPSGMAAVALNPGIIDTDMLRRTFGSSASHYQSADEWSENAVPFILKLGAKDNGKSLSVPS